jgi:hypothetical protein
MLLVGDGSGLETFYLLKPNPGGVGEGAAAAHTYFLCTNYVPWTALPKSILHH